ncbi:CspA family cold shock protein [Pseudomonas frederiksbergensis]|jgi:CspA family cold shock protein|nr:CspA family cold shock protein [Pseudomonas sp. URMO17WK12:I6]CAH0291469.1 Major cold shock protein CspA [Pseudomonas sp. Bi130]
MDVGCRLTFLKAFLRKAHSIIKREYEQMATRETGNVKWFNDAKGYGFIQRQDGVDVFVHYRAIRGEGHRSLTEGQQVEYAVVEGQKGLQAEDVVGL